MGRRTHRLRRPCPEIGQEGLCPPDPLPWQAALEILVQAKKGIDPRDANAKRKAEPVMAELSRRFLEEYVPAHCKPARRPGTGGR